MISNKLQAAEKRSLETFCGTNLASSHSPRLCLIGLIHEPAWLNNQWEDCRIMASRNYCGYTRPNRLYILNAYCWSPADGSAIQIPYICCWRPSNGSALHFPISTSLPLKSIRRRYNQNPKHLRSKLTRQRCYHLQTCQRYYDSKHLPLKFILRQC